MPLTFSMQSAAPLQVSVNRSDRKAMNSEVNSAVLVDRKVKGLLSKLTMKNFDSISDQIVAWANKSENENDGKTLIQVIRLVFEKVTDEATWSEMYARLCRKMMEHVIPTIRDESFRNTDGKPITGGHLVRKYLLNRCYTTELNASLMSSLAPKTCAAQPWARLCSLPRGYIMRGCANRDSTTRPTHFGPGPLPMPTSAPGPSPHANALGHTTSLRLLILQAQTPEPNRANAQRPRELSEVQSAVPTSPTITPIKTAPLPLGSIAMPGSAALPHAPAQALAVTRHSPHQLGSADSRPRKSGVTTPQSAPSNTNANTNSSPASKRTSTPPKRSRTLAVNMDRDAPVAGPPHSTTVGTSTLSANVTADSSTSTRLISSCHPGSTSTPASTSTTTPPKPKSTPATPTPKSKPLKLPPCPFLPNISAAVHSKGPSRRGKEVEEVLGNPIRVDAEVQANAGRGCEGGSCLSSAAEAEEADAIPISPAKEEVVSLSTIEDAKPVSLSQDVAIPLPLPAPSLSTALLPQEFATRTPTPQPLQPALHSKISSQSRSQPHPQSQGYTFRYEAAYPEVQPQQLEQLVQQPHMQQQQQPHLQVQQSRQMRDSFMLWRTACQLRVEYMQRLYTPTTIRDLVAPEADDYFLKHDYPKPWSTVRVQCLDGASELDADFFEEAMSAMRSSSGEDWGDYENGLSDEDGKYDDGRSKQGQDQDQDEDEDDPDAHDPSFNAKLSLSFLPKTRVPETEEGYMGAFYVPPSPMYDSPYRSGSDI
ncbi:hypothetical protein DXG01_006743 [Tephrocybe rancida]|nr:hypothetical protein DXG01_006743 [Tephrocybe rancida]